MIRACYQTDTRVTHQILPPLVSEKSHYSVCWFNNQSLIASTLYYIRATCTQDIRPWRYIVAIHTSLNFNTDTVTLIMKI